MKERQDNGVSIEQPTPTLDKKFIAVLTFIDAL